MSVSRRRRARTAVVLIAASTALFVGALAACSSFSGAESAAADAAPEGATFDGPAATDPDASLGDVATDAPLDDGGFFSVCGSSNVILSDTFRRYTPDDFTNDASANSIMQWTALGPPDPAGPAFTLVPAPASGDAGDAGFKDLQVLVPAGATATQFLHKDGTDGQRAYCITMRAQITATGASTASRMDLLALRLATANGPTHLIAFGLAGAAPQLALRTMVVNTGGTNEITMVPFDNAGSAHDFYLVVDLDRQMGALYIDPPDSGVPTPALRVSYDGGDVANYVLELGAAPTGGSGGGAVGMTTLIAAGVRFSSQ